MQPEPPDPRPIRALLGRLARVNVPRGDGLAFVVFASVAAALLAVEAVTGVLLALYFRPTVADANASVRLVVTDVEFGGLVRAVHAWGAHLLLVALGAGLAWAALRRAYRAPNGVAWSAGVALALAAAAETLTGSLLPWSERSELEARLSATLAAEIPLVGRWVRAVMLGGDAAGDLSLVRILGVHAGLLPLLVTACAAALALHAAGCAPRRPTAATLALYPHAALRAAVAVASVVALLVALASFAPPPVGAPAAAALARVPLRPSWYLAFFDQILRAAPPRLIGLPSASVIGAAATAGVAALLLLPVLDRRASRVGQVAVLVALAAIAGGTIRALAH